MKLPEGFAPKVPEQHVPTMLGMYEKWLEKKVNSCVKGNRIQGKGVESLNETLGTLVDYGFQLGFRMAAVKEGEPLDRRSRIKRRIVVRGHDTGGDEQLERWQYRFDRPYSTNEPQRKPSTGYSPRLTDLAKSAPARLRQIIDELHERDAKTGEIRQSMHDYMLKIFFRCAEIGLKNAELEQKQQG